jgi:hypothetical protein
LPLIGIVVALAVAGCDGSAPPAGPEPVDTRTLYLELMKRSLLDLIYEVHPLARKARRDGRGFPGRGMTMIGGLRLDNLQELSEDVIANDVPGDFIEAGAWRGGATIFMRGILKAHGITDRTVWVADSFEGLPPPNVEQYPEDEGSTFHEWELLAVSLKNVKRNFQRYHLLDDQVKFLEGWFKDTLPDAPIEQLAILRIDADMYQSTTEALQYLYPKLSPGGWVIVDDYSCIRQCAKAVEDYRAKHEIRATVEKIDWCGVYWQKPAS